MLSLPPVDLETMKEMLTFAVLCGWRPETAAPMSDEERERPTIPAPAPGVLS